MSDHIAGGAAERLEPGGGRPLPRTRPGRRRRIVAVVSALAVLGAGAGAVWAWQAFMSQGAQPAEALPASTLGYVAVDFNPAGSQKLAALGFLRKFPSLEEHVGLSGGADLRKDAFDELKADLGCRLGYADLEPWMGTRFAFAVVDQDGPEPVAVVQVADRARAAAGLERVANCSDGELGYALGDDWAVLAESDQVAERVVRDAAASPLTEDTEFQQWTGQAGDPGVVTLYAAPQAGPALVSDFENSPYGSMIIPSVTGMDPFSMLMGPFGVTGALGHGLTVDSAAATSETSETARPSKAEVAELERELAQLEKMTPAEQEKYFQEEEAAGVAPRSGQPLEEEWVDEEFPQPTLPAEQREALMNFSGLGGVVRFDDGALELELVSDRIEGTMGNLVAGSAGDDVLTGLPADTAAALSAGFRDGWGAALVQRVAESTMAYGGMPPADPVAEFEKDTGLTVADLEALGGDSFALVAGPGLDPEQLYMEPTAAKVAARISGNPDGVEAALTKIRAELSAADRALLHWRRVGDDVLVGANDRYLDELATSGELTGTGSFTDAVPDAGDAASVFYLNFDAGDWLTASMDPSERPDAEPLAGLGYTVRDEGDRERTLLRVTTED